MTAIPRAARAVPSLERLAMVAKAVEGDDHRPAAVGR